MGDLEGIFESEALAVVMDVTGAEFFAVWIAMRRTVEAKAAQAHTLRPRR